MDEELKKNIDNELDALQKQNSQIDFADDDEVIEWEDVNIPVTEERQENTADDEVIEWEDVNIPSYTTLDADTNKVYSVPATMDETDTRFAINTQAEKVNKDNFLGKVLLWGGKLAYDFAKDEAENKIKDTVDKFGSGINAASAGALDIGSSIYRGEMDVLTDYFERKEKAMKGMKPENKGVSIGLGDLALPNDVLQAKRQAEEAESKALELEGENNPVAQFFGTKKTEENEVEDARIIAELLNKRYVYLYEKWRKHNEESMNKVSLALFPEEERGKKDLNNFLYGVGNAATSIAGATAITLATKNPYVASTIISKAYFDSSKSEAFQEAIERGEDFETADWHSDILGAIDGVLEGVGDFAMMGIAKVAAPASKALKRSVVGCVEMALKSKKATAPVKVAIKNVARQSSVFKAAAKGFLTEGVFEELLQNVLGDEYKNLIGWQEKSQWDIAEDGLWGALVGGFVGGAAGAFGSAAYNRSMKKWNKQLVDTVKAYNPDIDDNTAQTAADLLQESYLQEGSPVIDELSNLLNKEKDPDAMPEGINMKSISETARKVMKDRYGVSDNDIDKWVDTVLPMIDARNQYNEVYQNFYEQLADAGRNNTQADAEARIIAARAVTLAMNEKKSTADILERWKLRIENGEVVTEDNEVLDQAMYKSPMPDFGSFYDDIIKNENTKDRYFTEDINGIGLDIPRNTIIHDINKHNLSKEEWQGVLEAIKNNQIKKARIGDYSKMRGTPVKMVVDVNGVEYGVAFDHMKSGRNLVSSAFVLEDKGWINEKQKKSSQMEAYKPLPNSSSLGNSMPDIIASLDNNVNDTLFQLPAEAYNKQGKADVNSEAFKRWFGDSKVVDKDGEPLVVYHGSPNKGIQIFDKNRIGNRDNGFFGEGFYFTPKDYVAEGYANTDDIYPDFNTQDNKGEIYPVYLDIKNPKYVRDIDEGTINTEELKQQGYDGVIVYSFEEYPESMRENDPDVKEEIEEAKGYKNTWWQLKNYYDEVIGRKYIDEIVVFEPNQIKSVYNRGTFSPESDNIYYQFAGENALTADTNSLSQARTMELNDYSDEEIYQETGWFKGADGKWRFEISDDEAIVDLSNVANDTTIALDSILQHDKLFAAYPELRNLSVMVDSNMKGSASGANFQRGVYDEKYGWLGQRISINPDILYRKDIDLKSILMHEIQHALQRKEGFATGGAPSMFFDKENMEAFQRIFQEQGDKKFNQAVLDALYGELSVDAANKISDADDKYLAASEKYINAIGETEENEAAEIYNDAEKELKDALAEAGKNADWLAELKAKAREDAGLDKLGKSKKAKNYNPWDLYKQLYGEIEARNTQARMDMSEEERRAVPPEETQDVKNADAIVVFDDGSVAAYIPERLGQLNPEAGRRPQGARGSFTRRKDTGEAIISLFETADASTVVHELGHFFLDDMRRFADNPETFEQLQAVYNYVGSKDGNLSVDQHEYFADSFEAYLLEGRAPNSVLKKVFSNFKKWMRNLWSEVKRLDQVKLTDEIRRTFDDMLGGKRLDFAMQQQGQRYEERLARGFISKWDINRAMELLHQGKISKADMQAMIDRLKGNEGSVAEFKQKLNELSGAESRYNEPLSEYDYNFYRRQMESLIFDKDKVRNSIERLLNWTKPRTKGGKLVGRFPDKRLNDAFDRYRELVALPKDEAMAKQEENTKIISEYMREGGDSDVEQLIFENKLLGLATGKISDRVMLDVYEALSESYNAGRLTDKITGEIKKARKQRLIDDAMFVLTGNGRINWRIKSTNKFKEFVNKSVRGMQSWGGLMDMLSYNDTTSTTGKSLLSQNMDMFEAEQKTAAGIAADGDNVSEKLTKALASSSANNAVTVSRYMNTELDKKTVIEWTGDENLGVYKAKKKPVAMRKEFTKDQLLDIYMKAQDKDTREIMEADRINQYNKEFLDKVESELTEQDIAVTKALFSFYNENYDRFNAFYEDHFGVSLPHNKYYSPRSMSRNGINVDDGSPRSYASFSGAKQRVAMAGSATINIKGAFAALNKYVQDLNHYMGYADALQDINAVFGDKKVKAAIGNIFGGGFNARIQTEIENFANNGKDKNDIWKAFTKIRSNYAKSVLGAKPSLAIKQLTSFPAYWENMSAADFVSGVADFMLHPKTAMNILGNTTLMKTRGVNVIRDFDLMSKTDTFKNMKKAKGKINWNDLLMANIKFGDRGAIYIGGWALYKSELKKNLAAGMGEQEAKAAALNTFERITDETQQSGRLSQQSYMQSNAALRAFTMFTSSQNQYLRKEINAIRGLASGRMGLKQAAKTIAIYHFILPMLFQFVSDGFRWDKDAQTRTAVLGSLNGWFILNKVLESVYDLATGSASMFKTNMKVRELVPFWGSVEDFKNMVLKMAEGDFEAEDVIKSIKTIGELSGLPLKYVTDVAQNAGDYADKGDFFKEGLLWLGWSPYSLRELEEPVEY